MRSRTSTALVLLIGGLASAAQDAPSSDPVVGTLRVSVLEAEGLAARLEEEQKKKGMEAARKKAGDQRNKEKEKERKELVGSHESAVGLMLGET